VKNFLILNKNFKKNLIVFIKILFFSFLFYFNSLKNEYNLDDYLVIRENPAVLKGISGIKDIFFKPYSTIEKFVFGYRPITKFFYAIEVEIFGNNLKVHHFFNIFYFALLSFLIFISLKNLFPNISETIIWCIILLWIAHPIHTEVINSLKNREEILYFIFSIIFIYFSLKFVIKGNIFYLLLALIFLIISYLTKESVLSFAFALPLISIFYLKSVNQSFIMHIKNLNNKLLIFSKDFIKNKYILRTLAITIVSVFTCYFLFKLLKVIFPEKLELHFFENPLHAEEYRKYKIPLTLYTLLYYIRLLFIPYPLLFYYGLYKVPIVTWQNINVFLSIIINFGIVYLILKKFKTNDLVLFGAFFFYLTIFPFLNFLVPINGIIGERFLNAPSLGFSIAFIGALSTLLKINYNSINFKNLPAKFKYIYFAILTIYFIIVINRNKDWKNEITLYSNDIKYLENSVKANDILAQIIIDRVYNIRRKYQYYGIEEKLKASIDSGIYFWKKSLSLYNKNPKAYNNLAWIYYDLKKNLDSALFYLIEGYKLEPNSIHILLNLGQLYYLKNKFDTAKYFFKKAIENKPTDTYAWAKLIELYFLLKEIDSVIYFSNEMLKYLPNSELPYNYIGNAYLQKKDTLNAILNFEKEISLNTKDYKKIQFVLNYYERKKDEKKVKYYKNLLSLKNEKK